VSTSRLNLYNDALIMCGERTLTTLTENIEPRRLLDHVWDNDGVKGCLESAQWKFAMRTIMIDYDTSVSPGFGYRRAFLKPTDWCATSALCQDEYFNSPLLRYLDEAGYWYADLDSLYVRYVSNDSGFGGDLSLWTKRFADYVASYFAAKIVLKLTSDENKQGRVISLRDKFLLQAKNLDAMADPAKFAAQGGWTAARGARRGDRGNRSSLTG
jgi:hypothetical protein